MFCPGELQVHLYNNEHMCIHSAKSNSFPSLEREAQILIIMYLLPASKCTAIYYSQWKSSMQFSCKFYHLAGLFSHTSLFSFFLSSEFLFLYFFSKFVISYLGNEQGNSQMCVLQKLISKQTMLMVYVLVF